MCTCTLGNSEDPDKIPHNMAFHQGLHCLLLRQKRFVEKKKMTILFEDYSLGLLDMYYGLYKAKCMRNPLVHKWLKETSLNSKSQQKDAATLCPFVQASYSNLKCCEFRTETA